MQGHRVLIDYVPKEGRDESRPYDMKKLVIASNNPGKLRELQFLLQPLGIEMLTQAQLGIAEAEEPHVTV
jgi:hypothetical protein